MNKKETVRIIDGKGDTLGDYFRGESGQRFGIDQYPGPFFDDFAPVALTSLKSCRKAKQVSKSSRKAG